MSVDRKDTRDRMRRVRRDVSAHDAQTAARALCSRLVACDFYQSAKNIAAYIANDGEIDSRAIIEEAWRAGKSVCLPVLQSGRQLVFAKYTDATPLRKNRYGIPEPDAAAGNLIANDALDVVLVPLVAFDRRCFRIGMGGGYYDKTFAGLRKPGISRPKLVGLAYEIQRVEAIELAAWDVPLWCIVTDQKLHLSDQV